MRLSGSALSRLLVGAFGILAAAHDHASAGKIYSPQPSLENSMTYPRSAPDNDARFSGLRQPVGDFDESNGQKDQQRGKGGDSPIWRVLKEGTVPLALILSFAAIFLCNVIWPRAVGVAVLCFGWGWLGIVVWFGLIQGH